MCVLTNEIPSITLINNEGKLIPIKEYVSNIYKRGEWAGVADLSMIPLVYENIRVSRNQMVKSINNDEILGFRFINNYGNFTEDNISILLLINIINNHYICGYYNSEKGNIDENFKIPNQTILQKKRIYY